MLVGAMIPSYVTFAFPEKLKLFGTVGVQSIFDSVIPNLLPALFVGILYYIFKKKKVSIVAVSSTHLDVYQRQILKNTRLG